MEGTGAGRRVRIYLSETDRWYGQPLYLAILDRLRAEGCAGATAFRGVAGFGVHDRIHTASIELLSVDLPIVVEWIDSPERVERVLPSVTRMVVQGMITVDETTIAHVQHRPVDDISSHLRVGQVMTRDVTRVRADLPLREAASLLIGRDYRALPVVDAQGRIVGILTNGDLVERGGLRARVDLLGVLNGSQIATELAAVERGKTVGDVMTTPVVTVTPDTSLADAAHLMVSRQLKRLPVVDAAGTMVGIISRADILRTRAEPFSSRQPESTPRTGQTVGAVMRTDVPIVEPTASLDKVIDVVVANPLGLALVVDSTGQVRGVITDAALLRRLSPEDHPSLLRVLMSRLPFIRLGPEEQRAIARAIGQTAAEVMDPTIPTVSADVSVGEAISTMLRDRRKILPVLDSEGRFVGVVDRADLLRASGAVGDGSAPA